MAYRPQYEDEPGWDPRTMGNKRGSIIRGRGRKKRASTPRPTQRTTRRRTREA